MNYGGDCRAELFGRGSAVKSGEEKGDLVTELLNYGGVCRAAPGSTTGLLITQTSEVEVQLQEFDVIGQTQFNEMCFV